MTARADILDESSPVDGVFEQVHGPFHTYRRTVADGPHEVTETIAYRLRIPWWGWLFAMPIRNALRHRRPAGAPSPWWAPPDQLNERQAATLALLAMASMSAPGPRRCR